MITFTTHLTSYSLFCFCIPSHNHVRLIHFLPTPIITHASLQNQSPLLPPKQGQTQEWAKMSLGPVGLMKKKWQVYFQQKKKIFRPLFPSSLPPPPKSLAQLSPIQTQVNPQFTTAHLWCSGHSTSINACEVWGGKGWGSSLQEGASHTYILRLSQSRNSILY